MIEISGQVLLPNGQGLASGTITYELDGNAKDAAGNKIVGRGVIHVPDGGVLTGAGFTIVATADLTPATRKYRASYRLTDADGATHGFEEQWSVPATPSPQTIGSFAV